MAFVVGKSRNPIVQAAFAGLRAAERAEKKAKPVEPADVHRKAAKAIKTAPDVHRKPAKAPAAKKAKRGGRK